VSTTTRRFAAGVGWLYSLRWVERLADFALVVVLARLLSPDDFGLVAIATSVVAIIEGLAAFDVSKALIRTRDDDRALFDTAWTLAALRGLLSGLLMLAIAPFVTDTRIAAILCVLALSPVLAGLANPRFVTYERELAYSPVAGLTLAARVVSVLVTLVLAVAYRSYWALVVGVLANTLASTVLSYALRPYRPRVSFARNADLFAFSGWLSLATIVTTLAMETDRIIVGRLLGIAEAGLYFMTQRVGVLPTRELISPLQRILFPSFSEVAGDRERLRRVASESIGLLGSLSLPAGVGFALIAGDFVPLALGPQWLAIIPLLRVLVPYLGVRGTLSMAWPCVMAQGEVRLLFWVALVYALVHLPVFITGTAVFGLSGAIWSIVLAGVFYTFLNAWMLRRTLGISAGEILARLRRPLLATGAMAGVVLGLGATAALGPDSGTGPWTSLLTKTLAGAIAFPVALFGLWRLEGRPPGAEHRLLQLLARPSRGGGYTSP
jgi:PST family polysaccharide transporter